MKKNKIFITTILFFVIITNVYTQETKKFKSSPYSKIIKVIVLPLNNYSNSDKKYLTTYLSELLKKDLIKYAPIEVLTVENVKDQLAEFTIDNGELYNDQYVQSLLSKLNIDVALAGRFIIHKDSFKLDYKLLNSNKVIDQKTYQKKIGDNFLTDLEEISESHSLWSAINLLGAEYVYSQAEQNRIIQYLNEFRDSKIGAFFSNKWIFFLVILLFFYVLSKFSIFIFEKIFMHFALKTETKVDDEIISISKKPVKWIIVFTGFKTAFYSLEITSKFVIFLDNFFTAAIIIFFAYIIIKSSDIIIGEWGEKVAAKIDSRINQDLVPLFENSSRVVIASIGILMVLAQFNIDIAPLIASLGIVGFAVGFAVKDSLSNVIGGIFLILDHSFAVGDKVTIDGDLGVIKEVGLRNTKLQTFDNEIIVIPNGELIKKKYKNAVLPDPKIRVLVNFGVAYGTDIDKVEEVVISALSKIEHICDDPAPAVVFIEMADFSLNFQAKIWVPDYVNQYTKWLEATKVVYNSLNAAEIEIPFPTRTVYIEKNDQ